MCLCVCTSLLPSIIAFLQVYYCISDAHRSKGCFSCIVCFAFLFLPLLRLSLTVSPWSLAWSHSTSCCTHTHYAVHEWKSCNKLLKPKFCSTLCCYFALQSDSLVLITCLFCNFVSLSVSPSLYRIPLITVPMFSLIIFIYSLPPSLHPFLSARQAGSRCWPEKDWHSEAGPLPAALTFLPDFDGAFEQRCVEGRAACLSAFQQLHLCVSTT